MSDAFSVSDMTVHRIFEVEFSFMRALDMLPGLTPEVLEENRAWMQPHSLDADDAFKMRVQSFIVQTPHHVILVDSCLGNHKPRHMPIFDMRTDASYLVSLARAGFSVADIDYVMCTHLHFDHVGWNTRLEDGRWVPTFPNARYVFGKFEYDVLSTSTAAKDIPVFQDSVLPIVQAGKASLVGDDFRLGDHVRILPTPGHSPGHAAICFGKGFDEVVMGGDLMHVPLQTRYPELSFVNDFDRAQAAVTRRGFLERLCDTRSICCMTHFPVPSSGRIKPWRNGFECVPVSG